MEIVDQEKDLEFLDLRINYVEGKLSVDVLAKQFYLHKSIYMLHVIHVGLSTKYHMELLLDYTDSVTLTRSLNLVLMNTNNIQYREIPSRH